MDIIHQALKKFFVTALPNARVDEETLSILEESSSIKSYKKGEIILKEGSYCKHIFILQKGIVRRFTYEKGKDITLEFAVEDEFITSPYSVISGSPSIDGLQAIEQTELVLISISFIDELYKSSSIPTLMGKKMRDQYLLKLEKRIRQLQIGSSSERYQNFCANHPSILQRANLGHIASYLGMTQETLSRIRAK